MLLLGHRLTLTIIVTVNTTNRKMKEMKSVDLCGTVNAQYVRVTHTHSQPVTTGNSSVLYFKSFLTLNMLN